MKRFSQTVVGIIVKTLILPEPVHAWGNLPLFFAQASKRGDKIIANLFLRERVRKNLLVELWI